MDSKIITGIKCDLSLINLNDPENSEVRFTIDEIEYLGKIPKSKVYLINEIIKDEIEKNFGTILILNNEILKAIEKLPLGKYKNGDGRKAEWIARQFKISASTVYQAQKILRDAPYNILQMVRSGKMPFKTAYKIIKKREAKNIYQEEIK